MGGRLGAGDAGVSQELRHVLPPPARSLRQRQPVPPGSAPGTALLGQRDGDGGTAQHKATAGLTSSTRGTDRHPDGSPGQRGPPGHAPLPALTCLPASLGLGAPFAAWPSPGACGQEAPAAWGLRTSRGAQHPGRASSPAVLPARTVEPEQGRQWPGSSETKGGGASTENLISLLTR